MNPIFCAANTIEFAKIAKEEGWDLGVCFGSPTQKIYYDFIFCDQSQKLAGGAQYKKEYLNFLSVYKPKYATVIDWTEEVSEQIVFEWAEAASSHVENVIVIPKVSGTIHLIPDEYVIGYSMPSGYGSCDIPLHEFSTSRAKRVHLLGGSPQSQMSMKEDLEDMGLTVVTVDCNQHMKNSQRCLVWSEEKGKNGHYWLLSDYAGEGVKRDGDNYRAFRYSCQNIMKAWQSREVVLRSKNDVRVRRGEYKDVDGLSQVIKRNNKHLKSFGNVSKAFFRDYIDKGWVYTAVIGDEVVGLVRFREKRNNTIKIYELAVLPTYKNIGIGTLLLNSIIDKEKTVELTCPSDLSLSLKFYEKNGFVKARKETSNSSGRKLTHLIRRPTKIGRWSQMPLPIRGI